jgi:hypothetical protein
MFLLGWITGAVLVAVLANRRDRSAIGWFLLSLLISPVLAGLFVLVLAPLRPTYEQIAAIAAVEALPADSHARQLLEAAQSGRRNEQVIARVVQRELCADEELIMSATNAMKSLPSAVKTDSFKKGLVTASHLFCIAAVGALVIFLFIYAASAQTSQRSFYDRNGSFAGSMSTHDNTASVYDRNGHFSGNAFRNSDGTTSYYDGRGRFSGSSPRPHR